MSEIPNSSPEGSTPSATSIDLASCLHPAERSRLVLALVGGIGIFAGLAVLVAMAVDFTFLIVLVVVFAVFLGFVWVVLQLLRARLLANAVRVEPESLPDLHTALAAVRNQLGYYRRVDVYVAAEVTGKAIWLNFLGHRVILLEGDFVDHMTSVNGSAGIRFVLGSFLGALKARHARLAPLVLLLEFFDAVKIAAPFLLPYHRATRYSGDQMGYLCAGSLPASTGAVGSLLVGNMVAPGLKLHGVVDQIELVQQRPLPRLTQLFSGAPHLVNRYLNLLAFSTRVSPEEFRTLTEDLDGATRQRLEWLMANTPHAREELGRSQQKGVSWPVLAGTASAVVVLIAVALLVFERNRESEVIREIGSPQDTTETTTESTPPVAPVSTYTAWELFGAHEGNGACDSAPPDSIAMLTGYEIEEVLCQDGEYSRWFYKYSGTHPDGWVNALVGTAYYDTVDFYEGGDCYDLYSATFTINGVSHNSMLYVFVDRPFIAEIGRVGSFLDPSDLLDADVYTTTPAALC